MTQNAEPAPAVARTPTVLVVEDEVLARAAIAQHLRDNGLVVFEAADVEQALILLHAEKSIAVVFADIRLPGAQNGIDLTRTIQRQYPQIKVLLTSGVSQSDQESVGGIPLLKKPYFLFDVERQIRALLGVS